MENKQTMKDFESELEQSFTILHEGDLIDTTVIGISETEITVDLNYYTEGIIPLEECSDDPAFSIKNDVNIGDTIQAMVIDPEDTSGSVLLSWKQAHNLTVWSEFQEDMNAAKHFPVKITEANRAGVTGYLNGIRAFIPASQLALDYVDDTESYVGMTVDTVIITADASEKRLVLSAKIPAQEQARIEKGEKISRLAPGEIVSGTVERMESYGVFINIGGDLTGLCHISQITNKFIKSPKEVLKLGETVRAKILKLEGDRISLSIKALMEDAPETETKEEYDIPKEYQADSEDASHDESPFAKLLQGIKL
ncbi:MAG: S1 RNA-binding domain-containing protein [Lachnospiraceae bacterium]|nr:S1 RNA-binding domain-containing protein [Lachnospiraceae bacterium]